LTPVELAEKEASEKAAA